MRLRSWCCALAAVGAFAGCATPPATVRPAATPIIAPVVAPAPVPPAATPLIESPPLEPVQVPSDASRAQSQSSTGEATPSATPAPDIEPAVVPAPQTPSEPTDEQQLSALLSDLQRYGSMNPDDLKRELNNVTQLLARQRSDYHRVRLAVLYTLTKGSPQDDQRAVQLLESVTKSTPGSPGVRQLAAVLLVQVSERARAVRDEQQKADAAVKKLEALRLMERDLLRDRIRGGGGGASGGGSGGGGGGGGGSGG
jgi:hypothetical protein